MSVTEFDLPSDTEVRLRRVVDAPQALVFDVYTSPEHLPHWMLGPPGWTMPVCEIDLRAGGRFRYVWQRDDETRMTISGTFEEIERPARIVTAEEWEGGWPATRNTVTLTETGGRTTITTLMVYPTQEARDGALASGMRDGMDASFDALDGYLKTAGEPAMRFELVPVPVSDIERALDFYTRQVGFHLDHDIAPGNGMRIVQLTPPGSACSIMLSPSDAAGSLGGLHLVVQDVHAVRERLLARGVPVGDVDDLGGVLYAGFADPDGNGWMLQEITAHARRPD